MKRLRIDSHMLTVDDGTGAIFRGPVSEYIESLTTPRSRPCVMDQAPEHTLAWRILQDLREAYDGTTDRFHHDRPDVFLRRLLSLCLEVIASLDKHHAESRKGAVAFVKSPVCVFGDIHGNYADLESLVLQLIPCGSFTNALCNFLFLGDYVDRGAHGIECAAFIMAFAVLSAGKVTLLRGNHEEPHVNSSGVFGTTSLLSQCRNLFGEHGPKAFVALNDVFRNLPLAAVVDEKIFCSHGGFPRDFGNPTDDRMAVLTDPDFPRMSSILPPAGPITAWPLPLPDLRTVYAFDCLWSDPAEAGDPLTPLGFGRNIRGAFCVSYGEAAVDKFLENHSFIGLLRGHQEQCCGVQTRCEGKVTTVFSTSGYCGHNNSAACVHVDQGLTLRIISKKPRNYQTHQGLPREGAAETTGSTPEVAGDEESVPTPVPLREQAPCPAALGGEGYGENATSAGAK